MKTLSILPTLIFAFSLAAQADDPMMPGTYLCQHRKPYDTQVEVEPGNHITFSMKVNAVHSSTRWPVRFELSPVTLDEPTFLRQKIHLASATTVFDPDTDTSIRAPFVSDEGHSTYEIMFYGVKLDFLCRRSACSPILSTLAVNLEDEVVLKDCRMSGDAQ